MICKNCGKELQDGTLLCDACGAEQKTEAAPGETAEEVKNTDSLLLPETADAGEPSEEKPKKKKKGLAVGIAVLLIAVICAAAVFAFPYIKNFALKTFCSDADYHAAVVKNALDTPLKTAGETVDTIKQTIETSRESGYDSLDCNEMGGALSVKLGEKLLNSLAFLTGTDISFLNDLSFSAVTSYGEKGNAVEFSAAMKGRDFIGFDLIVDAELGDIYYLLPELSDSALKISFDSADVYKDFYGESMNFKEAQEMIYDIYAALPDGETAERIADRYAEVILSEIDKVKTEKGEISAGGASEKCTAVRVTVDGETAERIMLAILAEAKDDDELWSMIDGVAEAAGEESSARDYFNSEYPQMQEDIKGSCKDMAPLEYTLYVNARGEIAGAEFNAEGVNCKISSLESDGKLLSDITVESDGTVILSLKSECTEENDIYNGRADLTVMDIDIADIAVNSFYADCSSGEITAALTDSARSLIRDSAEGIDSILGVFGISLDDMKLVFKISSEENRQKSSLALVSGTEVISINTESYTATTDAEVIIPDKNTVDYSNGGYEEWIATFDPERLDGVLPEEIKMFIDSLSRSAY